MTDPFFGPLVEALQKYSNPDAWLGIWNSVTNDYGSEKKYWYYSDDATTIADKALTSHDPAPVLRVLRAAVELEKERKIIVSGAASQSTTNFVRAESNHISAVKALLENPAYREWLEAKPLEGVE